MAREPRVTGPGRASETWLEVVLRAIAIFALVVMAIGFALWFVAGIAVSSDAYFDTSAHADLMILVLGGASVGAAIAAYGLIKRAPGPALWGAIVQASAATVVMVVFERASLEGDDPTPWRLGFGLMLLVDAYAAYRGWRHRGVGGRR